MNFERGTEPEAVAEEDGSPRGGEDPWWHRESEPNRAEPEGSTSALLGVALEEVLKLAEGVHSWSSKAGVGRTFIGAAEDLARAWASVEPADARYCRVCPVCRTLGVIDSTNPELARHLLEVMETVSELLQAAGHTVVADQTERDL